MVCARVGDARLADRQSLNPVAQRSLLMVPLLNFLCATIRTMRAVGALLCEFRAGRVSADRINPKPDRRNRWLYARGNKTIRPG